MKLSNPFKSSEVWVTQTYHTVSGSNTAIDLSVPNLSVNTPVYAIGSGKVLKVSTSAGSYVCTTCDGADFNIFYVHINRFQVKAGDTVKKGQLIGYIAPKSANGGYPMHLHLGLTVGYYIMDYLDRSIVFRTKYDDIRAEWFSGININWNKFRDLKLTSSSLKVGDYVTFNDTMNLRGGAGTGFAPIGTIYKGAVARIKDIRKSQNALFYGRGSDKQVNDNYLWLDGEFEGITGWFAVTSRVEATDKREKTDLNGATPVTPPTPKPEQPPQEAVVCLECKEWEKRYEGAREKNEGLRIELGALELKYQEEHKALKAEKEKVKILEIEKEDLANDLNVARVEQERVEKERLKLQEKHSDDYRNYTRWSWLIDMLNKIIPAKNDRKA